MAQFAVDVWRVSPWVLAVNWPEVYEDGVEARSAFVAIEQVMQTHGLTKAGYAKAIALDGSLLYRAHGVRLAEVVQKVEQADASHIEV